MNGWPAKKFPATGACLIITAAEGNPKAPEVLALRRYRDKTLSSSRAGRFVVESYYALSPALVPLIRDSLARRRFVMGAFVTPAALCANLLMRAEPVS